MSCLYLRLLVVDYEADKVSVVQRPVALPCQPDRMTCCDVRLELQDMTFTCCDRAGPSVRHTCQIKRTFLKRKITCNKNVDNVNILTAGSFTIVTEVILLQLPISARFFPHLVDLGHAEFGVQTEEETSSPNSQVVLTPVPQILQVLVVDGGERIHADNGRRSRGGYKQKIVFFHYTCLMEAGVVRNVVKTAFLPPGGSNKQ